MLDQICWLPAENTLARNQRHTACLSPRHHPSSINFHNLLVFLVVVVLLHFVVFTVVLSDTGVVVQSRCLWRLLLLPPQPGHLPLEHAAFPHTLVITLTLSSFVACLLPNKQKVSR